MCFLYLWILITCLISLWLSSLRDLLQSESYMPASLPQLSLHPQLRWRLITMHQYLSWRKSVRVCGGWTWLYGLWTQHWNLIQIEGDNMTLAKAIQAGYWLLSHVFIMLGKIKLRVGNEFLIHLQVWVLVDFVLNWKNMKLHKMLYLMLIDDDLWGLSPVFNLMIWNCYFLYKE